MSSLIKELIRLWSKGTRAISTMQNHMKSIEDVLWNDFTPASLVNHEFLNIYEN